MPSMVVLIYNHKRFQKPVSYPKSSFSFTPPCNHEYYQTKQFCLRKKCPYSELFWSVFTPYLSIFIPNEEKYRPNTDTFHVVFV